MRNRPLVSIGLPVFNGGKQIKSTIDSILLQTYPDFELIISDNASTDTTFEICEEYVAIDNRVRLFRNDSNLGAIKNFRIVFQKARGEYFAWAGAHDLWHVEWLQAHVDVLIEYPEVVLVYPKVIAISGDGKEIFRDSHQFETFGMSKIERIQTVTKKMSSAGNKIYGLFRVKALGGTSVYPYCSMPDRLLLLELSVYGTFKQIPRYLWYRRYTNGELDIKGSTTNNKRRLVYKRELARQRAILFHGGKVPWYSHFPMFGHALGLVYHLSIRPPSGSYANAQLGPYMAYLHLSRKKGFLRDEIKFFMNQICSNWQKS